MIGLLALTGCASTPARPPAEGTLLTFEGACDASGAVVLQDWLFAVGDDEDNFLRIYDGRVGGPPVAKVDLSPQLGLVGKKRPPELDIEAATGVGEVALWLTSHGRNSSGKPAPARLRLFATTRPSDASGLELVGQPYATLLEDLLAHPPLGRLGLDTASGLAPKEPGGLNIEAMTEALEGSSVWIGFRNPVPEGRALVVSLLNPLEVMQGAKAQLGEHRLLELGGLGMRSLSTWRGQYLIVAGPSAGGGRSQLFVWDGGPTARALTTVPLDGLNPEAFVTPDTQDAFLLLSDDGEREIEGVACKRLQDPSRKRFRALRVPETALK